MNHKTCIIHLTICMFGLLSTAFAAKKPILRTGDGDDGQHATDKGENRNKQNYDVEVIKVVKEKENKIADAQSQSDGTSSTEELKHDAGDIVIQEVKIKNVNAEEQSDGTASSSEDGDIIIQEVKFKNYNGDVPSDHGQSDATSSSTELKHKYEDGDLIIAEVKVANGEVSADGESDSEEAATSGEGKDTKKSPANKIYNNGKDKTGNCWMKLDTKQHFLVMDKLDAEYENIRRSYQESADNDHFDDKMLEAILQSRGVADRYRNKENFSPTAIPAGLNLGAKIMFRMRVSVLFFHRLKLRNATRFRIEYLHHDLMSMTLVARLSLHDLHLKGSYERALADKNPSILYYAPTYGTVEFLLKDVKFKVEGRYRLLKDRLTIETIVSEMSIGDIIMTYTANTIPDEPDVLKLHRNNIAEFAARVKTDLNAWIKDYFNDYLMGFSLGGPIDRFQKYDKKRLLALNEFADSAVVQFKNKLWVINATEVKIPTFKILSVLGMEILLRDGVIRGLHTMYRRSIATGKQEKDTRKVDAVVAFSQLKVIYRYEIKLKDDMPPLGGRLYLTSDELTALMSLTLANNSDSFDVSFDFLDQAKPETLIVEGSASTLIANFKHILGNHIIAIMTNALYLNIKLLGTLPKCEPEFNTLLQFSETKEDENENRPIDEVNTLSAGTPPSTEEFEDDKSRNANLRALEKTSALRPNNNSTLSDTVILDSRKMRQKPKSRKGRKKKSKRG